MKHMVIILKSVMRITKIFFIQHVYLMIIYDIFILLKNIINELHAFDHDAPPSTAT